MFMRVLKKKLLTAASALLTLSILTQTAPITVFAAGNSNGGSTQSSGGASINNNSPEVGWESGIAIFLHKGDGFVLNNYELSGQTDPSKTPQANQELAKYAEDEFSLTKAYAQIFRRTYISWNEADVQNSLVLMAGRNNWTNFYRFYYPSYSTPAIDGEAIRVLFHEGNNVGDYYYALAANEKYGSWTPNGKGVFKERLVTYMKGWFDGTEGKTPKQFIDELFKNSNDGLLASRIWSYIASGVDAMAERDDPSRNFGAGSQASPVDRWAKAFTTSSDIAWNTSYLTGDGIKVTLPIGGLQDMPSWDESDVGAYQVASYLDSLLTVALMLKHNGKSDSLYGEYIEAAIAVFGNANAYAQNPGEMEMKQALVVQRTMAQNWGKKGSAVADPTDFWALYHINKKGNALSYDYRSTNPYYNDYTTHPLLSESVAFKSWSGTWATDRKTGVNESAERMTLRLAMQSKNTGLTIGNSEITGGFNYPGLYIFSQTTALLGRNLGEQTEKMSNGASGDSLSSTYIDMVGPQFIIGMFGHNTTPTRWQPFAHSLSAMPGTETVKPGTTGTLNKTPAINYYFGTGFQLTTKQAYDYTPSTDNFFKNYQSAKLEDPGIKLQIRTIFSSRVSQYSLIHTGVAGDPKYDPAKSVTPSFSTNWTPITGGVNTVTKNIPVNSLEFSTNNSDWSELRESHLKTLLSKDCNMFTYNDERFVGYEWYQLPEVNKTESTAGAFTTVNYYKPGANYYLQVEYRVDTQLRIVYSDNTVQEVVYDVENKNDPTLKNYMTKAGISDLKKVPVFLAAISTGATSTKFDYATATVQYKYEKKPEKEGPKVLFNAEKVALPYAVYSSSPEAFAELKNWGVASVNEPGDSLHLGDGRSPVDTKAGVSMSYSSNGSTLITEDYEAMAGIPTTEKLYLAVGGSEFIVDIAVQYVPNETAVRAYKSHFDGVECQFNYKTASGGGGDTPIGTLWSSVSIPQPKNLGSGVTASVTTSNGNKAIDPHEGGTYTLTIQGTINNDGVNGPTVISDHDDADGSGLANDWGNAATTDRAVAAAQGSNGSGSNLTASEAAKGNGMPLSGSSTVTHVPNSRHDSPESWSWAVPNVANVKAFNDMMDDTVKRWIDDMVVYFKTVPAFKSGSDQVTRKLGNGAVGEFEYTKNELLDNIVGYPSLTPDSGSLTIEAPDELFNFDDGTGTKFNVIRFETDKAYSVTNPANTRDSTSSTCNGTLHSRKFFIEAKMTPTTATYYYKVTEMGDINCEQAGCSGETKDGQGKIVACKEKHKGIFYVEKSEPRTTIAADSRNWPGAIEGRWSDDPTLDTLTKVGDPKNDEYEDYKDDYSNKQDLAAEQVEAWEDAIAAAIKENVVKTNQYENADGSKVDIKEGFEYTAGTASVTTDYEKEVNAFKACTASHSTHAEKSKDKTWSAQYTFTVEPHILCGPCCGHDLPAINDVWQQSFNYDYTKIIGLSILRLDQGAAADNSTDSSGLEALIGAPKLGVTRQTFYSGPAFNIAQANIFNYMGLQTDGTLDVNKATNEYFRSIAVGSGTYGQTQSSEAGRVRYWITNADGTSKVTSKGLEYDRTNYNGNTPQTPTKYSNELKSEWGLESGLYKAHDFVEYDFGKRSNLCDGTSRGYRYNIDKRSWLETVGGVVRGKAAYDLAWAKGFIYDGIGAANGSGTITSTSTVGMAGFSVSKSYQNTGKGNSRYNGIYQTGTKGWDGVGVPNTAPKVGAYESDFAYDYTTTMKPLQTPLNRDWDNAQHNKAYTDTRGLDLGNVTSINPFVWPDAAEGDKSPRSTAVDTLNDKLGTTGSNMYNASEFLTAYTNSAVNSSSTNKAQQTTEYKILLAKRKEKVQATVISDILVLETQRGIMPILYYYRNAPSMAETDNRIPDTRVSFDEMWLSNSFTPNGWVTSPTGTSKDSIPIAGFNGVISTQSVSSNENQVKFRERDDELPSVVITTSQIESAESKTGKIGSVLGAKTLSGVNINSYLRRGSAMQVASYFTDNKTTSPTLLYNVSPIKLTAENRAYNPGIAEVFWETIVQWKDSSNHDYYSKYPEASTPPTQYLAAGQFVRHPELLGNYGQTARNEAQHTEENGAAKLADYFIDTAGTVAYGAAEARAAQAEQYGRGFGVTGFNYDTTNKVKVDNKTWAEMYNGSPNLTGTAKGDAYNTEKSVGMPFILEGVTTGGFSTDTATRRIGATGASAIAKTGYIQQAAYTKNQSASNSYKLNSIIVHTPITSRAVQIMPIADWRDQRIFGQSKVSDVRANQSVGCPGIVELCQFSVEACDYGKNMTFLNLNFIGSGKSVPNNAADVKTSGAIILAGNFSLTTSGLSSGGSARSGLSLSTLGADYVPSMNYRVTAEKITYSGGTEQMLFGFEKYGIMLNPTTGKLYIRVYENTAYIEVSGTFSSGSKLVVEFDSSNAAQSKVWVNGETRELSVYGGAASSLNIGSGQIGGNFYLGAWNAPSSPAYTQTENTRIQSLVLERLEGSTVHGDDCTSIIVRHIGGNNTHIHDMSHLGTNTSNFYLNGNLKAYNNKSISDSVLRERLGDAVYDALTNLNLMTTVINENVVVSVSTVTKDFAYTGNSQSFTAPVTGTYTFEVWGAQGGTGRGASGGLGGYSKGTYSLTAGQTISIYVGGQGNPYNLGSVNTNGATIAGGYNGGGAGWRYTVQRNDYGNCTGALNSNYVGAYATCTNELNSGWTSSGSYVQRVCHHCSGYSQPGYGDFSTGFYSFCTSECHWTDYWLSDSGGYYTSHSHTTACGSPYGQYTSHSHTSSCDRYVSDEHSSASGGGASDIRIGGTALTNRVIVAGGGGGASGCANWGAAGSGGGTNGGNAYTSIGSYYDTSYANGGSQSAGGTAYANTGVWARQGVLGVGASASQCGAGGGGGYYGGGAAYTAQGGGGSGYTGGVSNASMQTGVRSGNGAVRITYNVPNTKTYTITVPAGGKYELDAVTTLTSGDPQLTLYKGTVLTPANQVATNNDYSGLGYNSRILIMLDPGTYTILAHISNNTAANYNLKVTLRRCFYTYEDVATLPPINGQEAWRSIPYYLPDGSRNPMWSCNGEVNKHICIGCYEETTFDKCTEPHHIGQHYNDSLCYDPCMNTAHQHDTQFVQDKNVNTAAAEFVSIDWDFTLYASTIDNFRRTEAYQLTSLAEKTGRGYTEDEDTVRFVRGKYVRFPWYTLYDGVLYVPGAWIVLGDRGTYATGITANTSGFGGDTQGGSGKESSEWYGNQAAAYNVQNWSLYGQPKYKDLYKDFYDFYIPLANDELSLGQCIYAVMSVNAPTGTNATGTAPKALSDVNIWGINNSARKIYMADYGASKTFYVDLVGRVGGFVIEDVTDVKFSNTFKMPRSTDESTSIIFKVNMSDLTAFDSLQASSVANLSGAGVALNTLGDWAGFDYNGDNNRKFTLTINGNLLDSGELEIPIEDAYNGDYILRLSDMVVTESKEDTFTVTFSVKATEASVILKPRFRLIDNTVAGVKVSSMVLECGGSGYSYGLAKEVDQTKQNYYVTDVTDVRGVYIGETLKTDAGIDSWIRYGTYGTQLSENWVKLSDTTQVRDGAGLSQRNTPEHGTRAINTFGTRPWVQVNDSFYYGWIEKGGRALRGPLTSTHNTIPQYRTGEDQLAIGSQVLYDITTIGNYYGKDALLEIIPTYYAVDLKNSSPDTPLTLIPVDVYQLAGSGDYTEVNIFGAPYGGFTNAELDMFNQYRLSVNWGNEAEGQYNRRNVTPREYDAVLEYRDEFRDTLWSEGAHKMDTEFTGYGASTRDVPKGIIPVGGTQLVSQDYKTQTYIGGHTTYGVRKDGGLFTESALYDHPRYLYWEIAAQRWHTVLGLPSDSIFVPLEKVGGKYTHMPKSSIQDKALDISTTLIIAYIDVTVYGSVWTLRYGNEGVARTLNINGVDYKLPTEGPPGAGTSAPYTGADSVSSEMLNPGIPFVVFGGSKVPDMADIIKVN